MPHKDKIYGAFYCARRDATLNRKIVWLLSFEEWWQIWLDSGYWEKRGTHRGQYVMARYGDKGPYEIGNVRIILSTENTIEGWNNDNVKKRRKRMRKAHKMSPEGSAVLSKRAKEERPRLGTGGNKLSMKTRRRMSAAQRVRFQRERESRA